MTLTVKRYDMVTGSTKAVQSWTFPDRDIVSAQAAIADGNALINSLYAAKTDDDVTYFLSNK